MNFDKSVWDDSDPDYAPCIKKIRGTFYWVAPPRYKKTGYSIKTYKLGGAPDDGGELERAAKCRELTREMLQWFDGIHQGKEPGTWAWLIARYRTDEFSSYRTVRPKTREGYAHELGKIENAIGNVLLSETNHARLMTWKARMEDKGRSVAFIEKWFRHMMLPVTHGILIEDADCLRIKTIRSNMRISKPASRSVFAERADIDAVIRMADQEGLHSLSLALIFRFELALRGVDVYGQWEPAEDKRGGIVHMGRRWVDGITWDMFDSDLTRLTKQISKTRSSLPEPMTWDLTKVPELRERLMSVPDADRIGPVILAPDGLPPRSSLFTKQFKRLAKKAGLSEDLQIRDARAGAITEAARVANPMQVRNAAQHTQITTTDKYVRGRDSDANLVIDLRQARRNER